MLGNINYTVPSIKEVIREVTNKDIKSILIVVAVIVVIILVSALYEKNIKSNRSWFKRKERNISEGIVNKRSNKSKVRVKVSKIQAKGARTIQKA